MSIQSINLSWVVVKDLKQAVAFYTQTVGLKLLELNEQFGWAELSGQEEGMRLGIAEQNERDGIAAGTNAVVTFTVSDLEATKKEMMQKGAHMKGESVEVPGHVKMQSVIDLDGNHFQLVQILH